MLEVSFVLLAVAAAIALFDWRRGILVIILTAIIQDPLRKLVDGQPPYFILFVAVVFVATLLGAVGSQVNLWPNRMVGWRRFMKNPFQIYVGIVLIQAAHSFLRFGNPLIPILGIISYLAPFAGVAFAYALSVRVGVRGVRYMLGFYLAVAAPALLTLYLQFAGFDWPVLGEVGLGIRIHDMGTILTAYSGTFRASEIAAWHAATCACLTIVLLTERRGSGQRLLIAAVVVALFVSLGVLTGRRKMLVMVAIFASAYIALVAVFLRGAWGPAIAAVAIGAFLYFADLFSLDPTATLLRDASAEYALHLARGKTAFGEIPDRFNDLGVAPITWAYAWFGFFGGGLGIGTQGVQLLTDVEGHIGAAEGGLGKITLELGLPGLFVVGLLGVALARHLRWVLQIVSTRSPAIGRLACGLVALLIANAASFSVATQAYGDVFILLFLGVVLGFVFAMPVIAESPTAARYEGRMPPRRFAPTGLQRGGASPRHRKAI